MLNRTGVTVLGLLAVAGVAVAIVASRGGSGGGAAPEGGSDSTSKSSPAGKAGAPVFPDLVSHTADVSQIIVKRAPLEINIKKDGDVWRVAEKAGYPAKIDTVRSVVVGLSQLIREEEKTSRPEQYSKLGVEDPTPPPPDAADKNVPQSALITLKDDAGKTIAAAILGNPKYSQAGLGGNSGQQMFLRPAGEKAAWLVSGNVDVPREPVGWMETKFADIKRDRIKSFVITQPDSSVVNIGRDKQADTFSVQNIPAGRELKDIGVGESLASTLTGLAFQDVAAASFVQPPPAPADPNAPALASDLRPGPTIVVRTFDGLVVTVKSVSKEGKAWWTLSAGIDGTLAVPPPPPPPPAADGTPAPPPAAPAVGTLEALQKEASELNTAWAPYAFAPVDWKVRSINSTMADLLKDPNAAAPAPGAGAPPGLPPGMQMPPAGAPVPAPHR
jgi:hypothetical protein